MNMGNLQHRNSPLLLLGLFSMACTDGQLVAAPIEGPQLALSSEKVTGGGGLSLAVHETGTADGPPIVLIHGFGGTHLTWDRQLRSPLAAEFRLVSYDFRGHGASDKPLEAARYTDSELWAEDLDAVIRAKNLDRPVLVGWSYGGFVISDYIRKYGDSRIGGAVFLGAITKNGSAEAAQFLTDEVLALFGDVLSADVGKSLEGTRGLTRLFANPLEAGAWELAYGSAMMVPPEVRGAMFSRVLDNDDVLAGIRVPVLVAHGARDRIVRVSSSQHIASKVPGAKLVVYEGGGHAVHLASSERFNRDLAEFVRGSRGNRRP